MNKNDLTAIYSIICKLKANENTIAESLNPKFFGQVKDYISSFQSKTDILYYAAALLIHEESKNQSIYNISEKKMKNRLNNMMKFIPKYKIIQRIEALKEEAPANAATSSVAGLDNNPAGKTKKKTRLRKFAGRDVFMVDPNKFYSARLGKKRYENYELYVGNDEIGESIREYGKEHPFKPIILMNEKDGTTMFIRYGKNSNGGLI